jgi:hypothetical protein
MRLGYSKQEVVMRLAGNVTWDFELHPKPEHLNAVQRIADRVFKNRSIGGGGPPTLDH